MSTSVNPCTWPVELDGERAACGKSSVEQGATVWAGGDWPQAISLDLCQEHLDEARRPATGQRSSETPAPVADQPESGGPTEKLGALQDDQPTPGWHPKVGDRVIIVATNRAAAVTAELARDRFEVEPEPKMRLTSREPDERYEVYHLSELRQAYLPH